MSRVIADTTPTARKEHRCDLCGRTIRAGETYRRVRVAQITPQWCAHCDALVNEADFDSYDETHPCARPDGPFTAHLADVVRAAVLEVVEQGLDEWLGEPQASRATKAIAAALAGEGA